MARSTPPKKLTWRTLDNTSLMIDKTDLMPYDNFRRVTGAAAIKAATIGHDSTTKIIPVESMMTPTVCQKQKKSCPNAYVVRDTVIT
jgi:hypothetical protein